MDIAAIGDTGTCVEHGGVGIAGIAGTTTTRAMPTTGGLMEATAMVGILGIALQVIASPITTIMVMVVIITITTTIIIIITTTLIIPTTTVRLRGEIIPSIIPST